MWGFSSVPVVLFLLTIPWAHSSNELLFEPAGHLVFQISSHNLPWSGSFVITKSDHLDDSFLLSPLHLILHSPISGNHTINCAFKIDQIYGEEILFEWELTPFLLTCTISVFNDSSTDEQINAIPIPAHLNKTKFGVFLGDFGVAQCIKILSGINYTCDKDGVEPAFVPRVNHIYVQCGCGNATMANNMAIQSFGITENKTVHNFLDVDIIKQALSPNLTLNDVSNPNETKLSNFTNEMEGEGHFIQRQEDKQFSNRSEIDSENKSTSVAVDSFATELASTTTTSIPTTTITTTTPVFITSTWTSTTTTPMSTTTTPMTTTTSTSTTTTTIPTTTTTIPMPTTFNNPCLNYCFNGGTCVFDSLTSQLACICPPQYFGALCTNFSLCTDTTCLHEGVCFMHNNQSMCNCTEQYTGSRCESNHPCYDQISGKSPCVRGVCSLNKDGKHHCMCPQSYYGHNCEFVDKCVKNECKNGATCETLNARYQNASMHCVCPEGYSGDICDTVALGRKGLSGGEIAAILVCILLAAGLAVASYFLVKWMKNSRRLKGKYNPAKEENVANNGPPLPLTDLNAKEERLI